ncbi:MAG: hypothetical protein PGN13_11090 [Patulibacter minatonensis]
MSLGLLRAVRPLLLVALTLGATTGIAACGNGDGMSQKQIEEIVDRQAAAQDGAPGTSSNSSLAQEQVDEDEDARVAEEARKRREELDAIDKAQKAETEKILSGDLDDEDDAVTLAESKFRGQLAGVCTGVQKRIDKVAKAASKATKSKDPQELLVVAQQYNEALSDFGKALRQLDAPPTQAKLYAAWLGTIDDLASNIRLQLVSFADKTAYAKAEKKTAELATTFVAQTAQLGVQCFSVS